MISSISKYYFFSILGVCNLSSPWWQDLVNHLLTSFCLSPKGFILSWGYISNFFSFIYYDIFFFLGVNITFIFYLFVCSCYGFVTIYILLMLWWLISLLIKHYYFYLVLFFLHYFHAVYRHSIDLLSIFIRSEPRQDLLICVN